LTGKYRRGSTAPTAGTRVADWLEPWQPDSWEHRGNERTWTVIEALLGVAEARGARPEEVAMNWLRAKPDVVAPIIGARTLEQLESNLRSLDWELEPEELATLDEVSAIPPDSLYRFVDEMESRQGREAPELT
jgi:aryl-alcohol dehydrogenase-like predicted oxidoreductase